MRRNLRKSVYKITLISSMMMVLILCAGVSFAQTDWTQWHYYVNVDVNTGPYARTATPVEMKINFTNYLSGTTLNPNSVRVVEFANGNRTGTPVEVYSQFDQGSGFDATANAAGEVVWILRGTPTDPNTTGLETGAGQTRYYRVYFDSNTAIEAPQYTTDLTYDSSTAGYPAIANDAYKATIYQARATIYKLENKLTGAMMWNATATTIPNGSVPTDNIGMYYGVNYYPDGKCFGCVNSGASLAVSANKAVRVTYTTYKTFSAFCAVNWVMKFYAGGVPYFKNEARISKSGSDAAWQNLQIYYNDSSSTKRTVCNEDTVANPINTSLKMPMSVVYDYDAAGVNGGIGHLMGGDTTITNSAAYNTSGSLRLLDSYLDRGAYWKFVNNPWIPATLNNAVMVHNGTDQATAKAAVDKSVEDYGYPVKIMIVGSSNNSTSYGSIGGKVTDAADASKAVKGVMVRLWVNDAYVGKTYTSAIGDYSFSNVPTGTAKISVKCDGYETLVVTGETIAAGTAATKDISLPSIIFASPVKFINLKNTTADGTWKLITDDVCKIYNSTLATTTPEEITALAGLTLDSSITTHDVTVPSAGTTGWNNFQPAANDVYGWYRAIVNIPADWAGKNLRLRGFAVDNSAEAYFNGVYSGRTSAFGAANGHGCPADFRIPASAVNPGEANILAIKCYNNGNAGGIYWGVPILEVAADTAAVTVNVKGPQLDTWNEPAVPIQGATIKFLGVTAGGKDAIAGTTDANGNCTFISIPGDVYTVTISHPNYGTKTLTNVDVPDTGELSIPVTYDYFLCTVAGTVTQNNAPLANARVFISNGDAYATALTGADGTYSASGLKPGDCLFSVNALRSIPVTDEPITVRLHQVAKSVDLPCGVTPVYDDFSGVSLDTNKWEYFNSAPAAGYESTNSTAALADGILKLEPVPVRGGIISKSTFPKCGTYEVVFPKMYEGVVNASNQCFVIIKDKVSGHKNIVDLQDQQYTAGATQSRIKVFFNAATAWDPAVNLGDYPIKYSIVRTGSYYDIFVNGTYKKGLGVMADIPGEAYVFLNGFEADGAATPTVAYYDEIRAGTSIPVTPTTLTGARTAADGSTVSFSGAVVTASYDDCFFVENTDRSAGMKVISTSKPAVGKVAFIAGSIVKADSEVAIKMIDAVFTTDANVTTPKAVAVTGKVAGELDKVGAAAQGMLVKVAGTVTGVHTNSEDKVDGYFLDDGSGIVGDGANKGIFVEMDPAWGVTGSIVGKFKTVVSPLTVKKINDVVLPAVKGKLDEIPSTFTAYNDCSWSDGQVNTNITTYGAGSGFSGSTSGYLKDYESGSSFPVTATLTQSSTTWNATGGANFATGTDANTAFGGKVDFTGYINCPSTSAYVTLTFSGLDPTGTYEFVTSANANDMTGDSITRFAISGALAFTNASSSSAVIGTDGSYTEFNTGDNGGEYGAGYIAKWTGIQPAADGTFTVRAASGDNCNAAGSSYGFSAFMLKRTN